MNTLVGKKRRYHIESEISNQTEGTIYRAFSRRKSGNKIIRRYYAIVKCFDDIITVDYAVQQTLIMASHPLRVEEDFIDGDNRYIVIAKGKQQKNRTTWMEPFLNKGYLMMFLAALILILVIIKHFQ